MPTVSSPLGTTQDYIPAIGANQLGKFAGLKMHFSTLSSLNQAVIAERGNIAGAGGFWPEGQPFSVATESQFGAYRIWSLAGQHARTVVLGPGRTVALPSDNATLIHTTGVPNNLVGNDGDIAVDWSANIVYTKVSGAWGGATALRTVSMDGIVGATAFGKSLLAIPNQAGLTTAAGVQPGATANQTDSYLLDRQNHTGQQDASTISNFQSAADARVSVGIGNHNAASNPHSQYARASDVATSLSAKADVIAVNDALALKADTTTVNSALAQKANTTTVNAALALKADAAATTAALALKADAASVEETEDFLVQACELDPNAYVHLLGSFDVTVPAGETWYVKNAWHARIGSTLYVRNPKEALPVGEGTNIRSDGDSAAFVYYFRPSLVSGDSKYSNPRDLLFKRRARRKHLIVNHIAARTVAGQSVPSYLDFPSDFDNGLIIGSACFDTAWTILSKDDGATGMSNLMNEISDSHTNRNGEAFVLPFQRSVMPGFSTHPASVSGSGSTVDGIGTVTFLKLPADW